MFWNLFIQASSICTYTIQSQIGLQRFDDILINGNEVCINISSFPFYLIFERMNCTTVISEYKSINHSMELSLYKETSAKDLQNNYLVIPDPFASVTFSIKSPGRLSFSYGSLPGMCSTGVFFATSSYAQLSLHYKSSKPYDISFMDDKCFIFTSFGSQKFSLILDTEFCCDKLFVYHNFTTFTAFSGYKSVIISMNSTNNPILLRYISDDATPSNLISITMQSEEHHPFKDSVDFYDSNNSQIECPTQPSFHFPWVILLCVIASIIFLTILFGIGFYYCSLWKCPHFVKSQHSVSVDQFILPSENVGNEKGAEPKGYYILDPVLRPKITE